MNKPHKSRNSEPNKQSPRNILEIFSCSWALENFSHSRGLRTDISQKTVVGCNWVCMALMLVGPSKCLKQIILLELNRVRNPNWPEANQLAIYKRGRGFEFGTTMNKSSQRSWRDMNSRPLNCKSGPLTTRPRYHGWPGKMKSIPCFDCQPGCAGWVCLNARKSLLFPQKRGKHFGHICNKAFTIQYSKFI